MGKKFDAATKHLVEAHPADWLALAGLPVAPVVRVVDADVSAVTASADKVIRVDGPGPGTPYLGHLELQASHDGGLDLRVHSYNGLLRLRHRLPVWSAVFLLRPQAAGPGATGRVYDALGVPGGPAPAALLDFRYTLVRVWEQPVEALLAGGLGTLPLAPVTAVGAADVPGVIDRVRHRLDREAPPGDARELLAATAILLGLRYPRQQVDQFLKGVLEMEESDTYQAILEKGVERGIGRGRLEGRLEEARALLLRAGAKVLGPPTAAAAARVEAIGDLARLEALTDRVLDRAAAGWDDLLGG